MSIILCCNVAGRYGVQKRFQRSILNCDEKKISFSFETLQIYLIAIIGRLYPFLSMRQRRQSIPQICPIARSDDSLVLDSAYNYWQLSRNICMPTFLRSKDFSWSLDRFRNGRHFLICISVKVCFLQLFNLRFCSTRLRLNVFYNAVWNADKFFINIYSPNLVHSHWLPLIWNN